MGRLRSWSECAFGTLALDQTCLRSQGYDLELFAKRGLDTTGLDVAKTGVAAANKWLEGRDTGKGKATAVEGDFFKYEPETPFDLIYDYT